MKTTRTSSPGHPRSRRNQGYVLKMNRFAFSLFTGAQHFLGEAALLLSPLLSLCPHFTPPCLESGLAWHHVAWLPGLHAPEPPFTGAFHLDLSVSFHTWVSSIFLFTFLLHQGSYIEKDV